MNSHAPVIAIDGPSASGKGTVAQWVATKLGFHYLDSGALYRIVAYASQQLEIAWDYPDKVADCAKKLHITFIDGTIMLSIENGIQQEVSQQIRSEMISQGASIVAAHAPVRAVLTDMQRHFQQLPGLVADGRDMGTVIFPNAKLKVFLTASLETRAKRRYLQFLDKNQPADYAHILQDLAERDARDTNRTSAPLAMAENALLLETDYLSVTQAVDYILQHFQP